MRTSIPVAVLAARGLDAPETLTPGEIRSVCASALAQRQDVRIVERTPVNIVIALYIIGMMEIGAAVYLGFRAWAA